MIQSVKQTDEKKVGLSENNCNNIQRSAFRRIVESSVMCGIFTAEHKEQILVHKATSVGKSFSI